MNIKAKRIFMNEEGASPGGGTTPPAPATPTAAPTAPESPAPSIVDQVANLIDSKLRAFENGFFASARKAGVLGKEKSAPEPTVNPTPQSPHAAAPASTGLSAADVESMLEQERVLTRAATEHKLTDAQVKRMKSALKAEKPDDIGTWTSTFLADMGLVKAAPQPVPATAPQTPAPAPAPAARPNVSDRGGAAPTDTRDHNGVLHSRPLEMTGHDVDALILQHGPDKGLQMFQEHVLRALGNVRIKPPRG
jgi:hypothetical protein